MKVHERIKSFIKGTGLKQKYIAEKAGYTEKQFSAMMLGKKKIFTDDLERICQALEVGAETFINVKA